jgi:DUF4097 and DUF4098 domain-containing protein YvlB
MAAEYPSAIKSWTPVVDDVNHVMADDVNSIYEEIEAVQTELGEDVAGDAADLVTRLSYALDGDGYLQLRAASSLTISSGTITISRNVHYVDTEGAAATDDLDSISGGDDHWLLFLRTANDARDVVIKHNTGNIRCSGALDITLSSTSDVALLLHDGGLWYAFAGSPAAQSGQVSLAGNNTWTGTNTYSGNVQMNASVGYKYTAVSAGTTLDGTHHDVNVDATAGAVTITLPTAVGITGRRYWIRKLDSSANAVVVDGDGSETINGALTYSLTSQYATVEVESNGANWMVR